MLLDQSFAIKNCTECDFDEGIEITMRELRAANPDALFASEVAAERYAGLAPFCQWIVHSEPSLKIYFDPRNKKPAMKPAHLRRQLYGDYVRFWAHLFLPAAVETPDVTGGPSRFQELLGVDEAFARTQGVLDQTGCVKSLRLNYRRHGIDPVTRRELERVAEVRS